MDWEGLRQKTLAQVGTAIITEGAGTAGGFVGAAFVGRQVQNLLKQPDQPGGFGTNYMGAGLAWLTNNAPKALIWYFTRKYAIEPGEAVTPGREVVSDARKALAGSIVFDTLMRLGNGGINPATATAFGWQVLGNGESAPATGNAQMQADVQRLVQENTALRAELNKALQRLAVPPQPRDKRYGFMKEEQQAAQPQQREKKYGFAQGSGDQAEQSYATSIGML